MTRPSRLLLIIFAVLFACSLFVPRGQALRAPAQSNIKFRQRVSLPSIFKDASDANTPLAPTGTLTIRSSYPASMDPPNNFIPGSQTFTLTKQPFSSSDCTTGPGAVTTVTGVNSSTGHTLSIASGSIGLQAPQNSDQNGTFAQWNPVSGNFGNLQPWAGHTNGICIASSVSDTLRAVYNAGVVVLDSTCTNPKAFFNLGETVCGRIYGDPAAYCPAGASRAMRILFKDPSAASRNCPGGNCSDPSLKLLTDLATTTFTLPSTNTTGAVDNRGHWLAQSDAFCTGQPYGSEDFLVHNPAALAADVQILKSAFTGTAAAGGTMQYEIKLFNSGPDPAQNAAWADTLPAGTSFVSLTRLSGPGFTCSTPASGGTGTINCSTATLPAGNSNFDTNATGTFRLVLKFTSTGTITNTATGTSSTSDQNSGNNSSSASVTLPVGCSFTNGCPADINVAADTLCSGVPGKVVTFANPATTGTCGALTATPASGTCFTNGTTTVQFQDGTGLAICTFRVTVTGTPTVSGSEIAGTIVDDLGQPIEGVTMSLGGAESRKTITDANGHYRFENVAVNGFYNLTPSRVNYQFTPAVRSFSQIGQQTDAAFTAIRDAQFQNPITSPDYFVRQQYLDFLGREPDESGFSFWSNQILECGADAACVERRTINVSAAYFLSIEFQSTGGLVDGLYRTSFGRAPLYAEFMPDTQTVADGVVVGRDNWAQQLEANKQLFIEAWMQRADFRAAYDGLSNASFVDTLLAHTSVSFTASERDGWVNALSTGTQTRTQVLRSIAENQRFLAAKQNEMFVMMEYFGYLRRDPDASGYQFWLNKLNEFGGNFEQAEMVKSFLVSGEYRARFTVNGAPWNY